MAMPELTCLRRLGQGFMQNQALRKRKSAATPYNKTRIDNHAYNVDYGILSNTLSIL